MIDVVGADPEIVALGLPPSLEERIAAVLMERYRGNDIVARYFRTVEEVESEAILEMLGGLGSGGPTPALYLALRGSDEKPDASAMSQVVTAWDLLVVAPAPPELVGPASRTRSRLVHLLKRLTVGVVPGVIENDDDPDNPLAYQLVRWYRVDAAKHSDGMLRTLIGCEFASKIRTVTREVV